MVGYGTPILPTTFNWVDDFHYQGKSESPYSDTGNARDGRCTLIGLVDFDKLYDCQCSAVGYTYIEFPVGFDPEDPTPDPLTAGYEFPRLMRKPPIRHPYYSNLRCKSFDVVYRMDRSSGDSDPISCDDINEDMDYAIPDEQVPKLLNYDRMKCVVKLSFEPAYAMDYFTNAETPEVTDITNAENIFAEWYRYVEWTDESTVEGLTNENGRQSCWIDWPVGAYPDIGAGKPPIPFWPPAIRRQTSVLKALWREVPEHFIYDFRGDLNGGRGWAWQHRACESRLNSEGWLGYQQQSLFIYTPTVERALCPLKFEDNIARYYVDVTMKLLFFGPDIASTAEAYGIYGHQVAPHPKDLQYYPFSNTGDAPPTGKLAYDEVDIRRLFFSTWGPY